MKKLMYKVQECDWGGLENALNQMSDEGYSVYKLFECPGDEEVMLYYRIVFVLRGFA